MTPSDLVALVARLRAFTASYSEMQACAAAIEQLQAELAAALEDASELRALDNEAQHGADALRAELAACQSALWQSSEKITPGIAKAMSAFFTGWAKRLEDAACVRAGGK